MTQSYNFKSLKFFFLISFLLASVASAVEQPHFSVLISLKKKSHFSSRDLNNIKKDPQIISWKSVFNSNEQNFLIQTNAKYLTYAWVAEVSSEQDFLKMKNKFKETAFRFERNDFDFKLSTEIYENLQWGLHNQGLDQVLDLDIVKSYRVPGVQGEDIHLTPTASLLTKPVIVAVLDTGVDHQHPDLKNVLLRRPTECEALQKMLQCSEQEDRSVCEKKWLKLENPEVDQDKNGYPLDCSGWTLLGGKNPANIMGHPDFEDDQGHGTHVAGIIAAEMNNRLGVRGVSNHVSLLPVQVIGVGPSEPLKPQAVRARSVKDLFPSVLTPNESVQKPSSNRSLGDLVARGVIYAIRSGAKVLNFSLGWPQARDSEYMRSIIQEAQKRGALIVAAAGNDSTRALLRPCAYEGVICVGAHGPDGSLAHFSNYGSGVDIAAPGINILSTFPTSINSSRFRAEPGYEYLSGTSQASPFVAGAVAEMLARGIPANEIYPRLILGARPLKTNQALIEGLPHQTGRWLVNDQRLEKKYILSGMMGVEQSLSVKPQELILPLAKEVQVISWDRQSSYLKTEFKLKNHWKDIQASSVKMNVQVQKKHGDSIRPEIQSFQILPGPSSIWKMGEIRTVQVQLQIKDQPRPFESEIPSELNLIVQITTPNFNSQAVVENEILVDLSKKSSWPDLKRMKMTFSKSEIPESDLRTDFLPVDEVWDLKPQKRDYFLIHSSSLRPNQWDVQLLQQFEDEYRSTGQTSLRVPGDIEKSRVQITARLSQNGESRYVIGFFQDQSDQETRTPSPMKFMVYDEKMNLVDSYDYDSSRAQIPFQVFWQRVGSSQHPSWIGFGQNPSPKDSLRDRWENPTGQEKSELRFYFLDENKQLKALQKYNDYKLVDIIEPTQQQKNQGVIPVLLAKNRGTEAKPSYLYDFARAEVYQGQIQNFVEMNFFGEGKSYRNLLDTRVDKVLNLDRSEDSFAGTFWFSEGSLRQQRLSVLNPEKSIFIDQEVTALNKLYDSALWVRAAFSGEKSAGAFILTNSEIQYHDLLSGQVVAKSFERYTFFPDSFMTNSYFPVTVASKNNQSAHRGALFTTESSGLSRGVKMVVPIFAKDGSVIELVSPARLRLRSGAGCRPLNTPVFLGRQGYAFDYFCGDEILRLPIQI